MKKILLLMVVAVSFCAATIAQMRPITGKVVDKEGKPISGASIKVKGRQGGTAANADGEFTIQAKAGDVLVVSSLSFAPKQLKVGSGSSYSITLEGVEASISEVVVTALGVKKSAKELGYSTAVVSSKELTQAATSNFVTGLAAKVSGVDIRLADNGINPSVKITFRGSRSISGNNTALVIVDGNPVDQSYVATISPDDIDNVSILKGPNAAALYGKDAANGVMVITTKHGKNAPVSITYKNATMLETVAYMPGLQYEYSPNGGEAQIYNNPSNKGGCLSCVTYIDHSTGTALPVPFENQSFGTAYNSLDFPYTQIAVGIDTNGNIKYVPFKGVKDGRRSFFQTGLSEQNDLSISGGGKIATFHVSQSNVHNKGVIPTETNVRNTFSGSGTLTLNKFTASGGVSYSTQDINQVGLGYSGPNQYRPVYWNVINQPAHVNLADFKNVDTDPFVGIQGYVNAYYPNPWYQVNHSHSKQTNHNLIANLTLNYQLFSWLKLTSRIGYNKRTRVAPSTSDSFLFHQYNYGVFAGANATYDPYGGGNIPGGNHITSIPYLSEVVNTDFDDLNADEFFTITKKVKDFGFTLLGGANFRAKNSHAYWWSNQGESSTNIPTTYTTVQNADGSAYLENRYHYRSQSAYSDLLVSYQDWVYLHGTFRNDWLSIFDPKTRSFNYYGTDVSLVLSDKISALKNHDIYLKVRGGYTITGNESLAGNSGFGFLAGGGFGISIPNFGAYSIYNNVNTGGGFPSGTLNGYSLPTSKTQDKLQPEKDYSSEAGFELGFLKNRILLDVSAYSTVAKNQNFSEQTSTASGITSFDLNSGKITSRGVELGLKLTPFIKLGSFSWNVGVTYSKQDTKVNELLPGLDTISISNIGGGAAEIALIKGAAYPQILVKDFVRDPSGHIIVDGTTGMPTLNPRLQLAGNSQYTDFLGLSSNMTFKGFTLSTVWDYRGGSKILNSVGYPLDFAGISQQSGTNRQHFIIPGSVIASGNTYTPNTNIPITGSTGAWWYQTYSSAYAAYVTSANFWKLRELSLGYDIPLKSGGILKKLNVALVGQNLLMLRPKTNQWTDPEFSNNGTGNAVGNTNEYQTPPTRRYGFTLTAVL